MVGGWFVVDEATAGWGGVSGSRVVSWWVGGRHLLRRREDIRQKEIEKSPKLVQVVLRRWDSKVSGV